MTPNEIITRAVQAIPGIRLPRARLTVERIMLELEENGYEIRPKEKAAPTPPKTKSAWGGKTKTGYGGK